MTCFLAYANGATLSPEYEAYPSLKAAKAAFDDARGSVWRYGQRLAASIHIAESVEEIAEYPDYLIETGPRGGLKIERT